MSWQQRYFSCPLVTEEVTEAQGGCISGDKNGYPAGQTNPKTSVAIKASFLLTQGTICICWLSS
jgi:hypothetical protein